MKLKISVVIPALNEEALLLRCIKSLKNQNYPREKFEIILVDSGSTDKTVQIARKNGVRVFIKKSLETIGASRDFGAKQAKGEIIAFTDSDSFVAADWLLKIDQFMETPNLMFIGGQALPDSKSIKNSIVFGFYHFFHIFNYFLGKPIVWGFNMAIKKSAYKKVGGINTKLKSCEDWDLSLRIKNMFGKDASIYNNSLKVFTSTRKHNSFSIFIKYSFLGIKNYYNFIILKKIKAETNFIVR